MRLAAALVAFTGALHAVHVATEEATTSTANCTDGYITETKRGIKQMVRDKHGNPIACGLALNLDQDWFTNPN
jgi:hypothetical protein